MAQSMIQAILQLLQDGFQNSTIPVIPAYSRKPVPPPDCKQPYGIYSIQQLQVQKPVVRKETCYYALEAELHLTCSAFPYCRRNCCLRCWHCPVSLPATPPSIRRQMPSCGACC